VPSATTVGAADNASSAEGVFTGKPNFFGKAGFSAFLAEPLVFAEELRSEGKAEVLKKFSPVVVALWVRAKL